MLKEKTPDLLALLTTYNRGNDLVVPIVHRPLTPAPSHTFAANGPKKKRKRGKQIESSKEGEIPQPTQ